MNSRSASIALQTNNHEGPRETGKESVMGKPQIKFPTRILNLLSQDLNRAVKSQIPFFFEI